MKQNIYGYERLLVRYEERLETLDIPKENNKIIIDFKKYLFLKHYSIARILK
ncbi:hypothetical protein HYU06_01645 [Candidatus Woesearchaeota archaeon]|nr:hypothetical protein [Candidatus Woesearchaeota archaeon]